VSFVLACPVSTYAQACQASNLRIKVNSIVSTAASCQVNATISWAQKSNSANKFTNFHIWTAVNYPGTLMNYSKPPSAADLANALGTFVIANPGSSTPSFYGSYPPAAGVTMIAATASTVVSKIANMPIAGLDSFNVSNVLITLSGTQSCLNHFILKADVWSCQASNDQTIQCFTTNGTFATADLSLSGKIFCLSPRKFQINILNNNATSVNFTYQVYANEAQTNSYSPTDPMIYSGSGAAAGGATYSSAVINYGSYPYDNLIMVVQAADNPISSFGLVVNACSAALPVNFTYFSARRTENGGALLSWGTAMEQNNKGFEVQRKTGAGDFETIAFVDSKASDGNSTGSLAYEYTDLVAVALDGDIAYRLAQTDLDGQKRYSSVTVVTGEDSAATLSVYPNPSPSGNVTVTFSNTTPKDIIVCDISGKIIKRVSEVVTSQYILSGLQGGIYILKVINNKNSQTNITKILINK
jgi:hypothetical protein